jgi:hypothetical protein
VDTYSQQWDLLQGAIEASSSGNTDILQQNYGFPFLAFDDRTDHHPQQHPHQQEHQQEHAQQHPNNNNTHNNTHNSTQNNNNNNTIAAKWHHHSRLGRSRRRQPTMNSLLEYLGARAAALVSLVAIERMKLAIDDSLVDRIKLTISVFSCRFLWFHPSSSILASIEREAGETRGNMRKRKKKKKEEKDEGYEN